MRRRHLGLIALAAVTGCVTPPEVSPTPSPSPSAEPRVSLGSLARMLRAGGVTLLLAHPTSTTGAETPAPPDDVRLTPIGKQQARELGSAFARQRFRVGGVWTSPAPAARETARLAFDGGEVEPSLSEVSEDPATRRTRLEAVRRLLAEPVPEGEVTVLIGHPSTIKELADVEVPPGGGIVVVPRAGGFDVEAVTRPNDWARLSV